MINCYQLRVSINNLNKTMIEIISFKLFLMLQLQKLIKELLRRAQYIFVYFDTSAKVLILARVLSLSPERSEGDNHMRVKSSFVRVSNDIFRYKGRKSDFNNLLSVQNRIYAHCIKKYIIII